MSDRGRVEGFLSNSELKVACLSRTNERAPVPSHFGPYHADTCMKDHQSFLPFSSVSYWKHARARLYFATRRPRTEWSGPREIAPNNGSG